MKCTVAWQGKNGVLLCTYHTIGGPAFLGNFSKSLLLPINERGVKRIKLFLAEFPMRLFLKSNFLVVALRAKLFVFVGKNPNVNGCES